MKRRILRLPLALLCALLAAALILSPAPGAKALTTKLRVALNVNLPPYQYLDDSGALIGMHIDLLNSIAYARSMQLEYIPCENDRVALNLLLLGKADIVLGSQTNLPAKYDFAQVGELSSSILCMIARNETAAEIDEDKHLYSYTMVTDNSTNITIARAHLDQTDFGRVMRIITSTTRDVFDELESQRAQIALIDREIILHYLRAANRSDAYTILNNSVTSVTYTMLVRKSDHALQRSLEIGLSDLRLNGDYARIRDKWIKGISAADVLKKLAPYFWAGAAALLAYFAVNLYINRTLKRKVLEQTNALTQSNRQLEQRMRQLSTEREIRGTLIETLTSGIVIFDEAYTIRLFNQNAGRIAGRPLHEGIDIRSLGVFSEAITKAETETQQSIFEGDRSHLWRPAPLAVYAQGSKKIYRYSFYSFDEYEQSRSILILLEDVTQEENLRQQTYEAEKNRSLNMLVAGMAHEIKNPLMAISTFTATLPQQIDNPEFRASFIKYMPLEISRINRLVESLMNYARPIKGDMERLDVAHVIKETLYLVRAMIAKKPIRIETQLEEDIRLTMNQDKMKQALFNFAANGVESMEKKIRSGGVLGELRLCIALWSAQGKVYLTLRDEGTGMSPEAILHCTDPFFTTKSAGTGLGMSLARQFVEDNNGTLEIHSEEGRFTKITLVFQEV